MFSAPRGTPSRAQPFAFASQPPPGTPCTPMATLYTDATLTVPAANPLQTDGIGNYHFYAAAGRYQIQITGLGHHRHDDVSRRDSSRPMSTSTGSGSDITAFGLTLGGNLSVAGNASIAGTFSTGDFSPSSLSVTGNASVAGPRPYIDVTAYGAVGNNSHDDTSAIQNAINALLHWTDDCQWRQIYFPPGTYKVSQPQTPSTSPVFTICSGIHILGGNSAEQIGLSYFGGEPQCHDHFVRPAQARTLRPCFSAFIPHAPADVTFENLRLIGYNEEVYINQSSNNRFIKRQADVSAESEPPGMTDNTPLKICDSVWNWYEGGRHRYERNTTHSGVLLCTDSTPGNFTQWAFSYFENMIDGGWRVRLPRRRQQHWIARREHRVSKHHRGRGQHGLFHSHGNDRRSDSGRYQRTHLRSTLRIPIRWTRPQPLSISTRRSVLSGVFIKSSAAGTAAIR